MESLRFLLSSSVVIGALASAFLWWKASVVEVPAPDEDDQDRSGRSFDGGGFIADSADGEKKPEQGFKSATFKTVTTDANGKVIKSVDFFETARAQTRWNKWAAIAAAATAALQGLQTLLGLAA